MAGYQQQGPYGTHQGHGGYNQGGFAVNQEKLVTIYCENNPNFRLSMRPDGVVLAFKNPEDPNQQWFKIDVGDKFKDQEGSPGFVLVNKGTGQALRHGTELGDAVVPQTYQPDSVDSALLWSQGKDEGKGYHAVRPVTNIHLNLDADHGDKKHGGVKEGNRLIVHKWNEQNNQLWKIAPLGAEDD
ncbi:hypothetical protein R1sor_013672 [Riccia sorocarpa]|uniref:Ricin B lectin domain-containing protein n=1 Tax=Riccia sorocarpa TaxID=122646 RepID=A0ABD3H793_9MARC